MSALSTDDAYMLASAAAAFFTIVAVGNGFIERDTRTKRLKMLRERRAEIRGEVSRTRRRARADTHVNLMRQVVNRFQLLKSHGVSQIQKALIEAGWRSRDALVAYLFLAMVLPIVLGAAGLTPLLLGMWTTGKMKIFRFALPAAGAYVGMKLPMWVARWKRKRRYHKIRRALSDTLDLLTICAEAGLTLSVAFERVSRELGLAYPEMAEELALTAMEMGLLPERGKAFANLTERVNMQEVRGVVSVLTQTEKYGTPVAQAMRVLSAEFREQRMLAVENKAARLGPMMTMPMMVFILPTLFIVILSPAVIHIMDILKNKG